MQGGDGDELVHFVRQQAEFAATSILVMADAVSHVLQVPDADAISGKSVNHEQLLEQLQGLLASAISTD